MAKTVRKPKLPSTTIKAVEKLFGPVLPGMNAPERTISVFQEYTSPRKYKLFGQPGIIDGAIWHLHTQVPILAAKIKGRITGILEGGSQHDPKRQELVAAWLSEHLKAEAIQNVATARKAAAAEAKRQKELLASRAGEYDARLMIEEISTTIPVRVKVDAKGKVTLVVPKGKGVLLLPVG